MVGYVTECINFNPNSALQRPRTFYNLVSGYPTSLILKFIQDLLYIVRSKLNGIRFFKLSPKSQCISIPKLPIILIFWSPFILIAFLKIFYKSYLAQPGMIGITGLFRIHSAMIGSLRIKIFFIPLKW